jgi:hypothetical protein
MMHDEVVVRRRRLVLAGGIVGLMVGFQIY